MKAAIVGFLAALGSAIVTAVYLASIRVDDGLEALLFLPVLGVLLALTAAWAGWLEQAKANHAAC